MIFGPPGSGKGTQANLLATKMGLIHFDTGKYLEGLWYDPRRKNETLVRREKKLFEEGKLNTPQFVSREVSREVKRIAGADFGVVFSGSPRTLYETKKELPLFEELYGKKNVFAFVIDVPLKTSIERNSRRLVCTFCGYLLLTAYYPTARPKHCPVCGGSFRRRTLDTPEVIKVRLKEYRERTAPVFAFLRNYGQRVVEVDGRPAPYRVFQSIERSVRERVR